MNAHWELVPLTVLTGLLAGALMTLWHQVKPPLAKRLGLEEAQLGWQGFAFDMAFWPGLLLAGLLTDNVGVEWVLTIGFLLAGFALALLAVREAYSACLATVVLLGVATAWVLCAAVVLSVAAFDVTNPAVALNWGTIVIAGGSLLLPFGFQYLLTNLQLRRTLGVLAITTLLPVLVVSVTNLESVSQGREPGFILFEPLVYLAAGVFFLYVPVETLAGIWSRSYLTSQGYGERSASFWLAGFWIAFLAGRAATALFIHSWDFGEQSASWLVLGAIMLSAVAIGNLASSTDRFSPAWGLPIAGFVLGPIFPTLTGVLFEHFSGNGAATAFAVMFALGSMGGPLLTPVLSRTTSGQTGFRVPIYLALGMGVITLAICVSI